MHAKPSSNSAKIHEDALNKQIDLHQQRMASLSTLWTSKASSQFAFTTMSKRIPAIALEVAQHNQLSESQSNQLIQLSQQLPNDEQIPQISSSGESEAMDLATYQQLHTHSWLQAPWFVAESYFFRLVLDYSGYFTTGADPFRYSKEAELDSDLSWQLVAKVVEFLQSKNDIEQEKLISLLKFCLWGNKADACFTQSKELSTSAAVCLDTDDSHILVNHTTDVYNFLSQVKNTPTEANKAVIQFVNDNCGRELLLDLVLADHLLTQDYCDEVVFNVKAQPTYVSDAIEDDVFETISHLAQNKEFLGVRELGFRLQSFIANKDLNKKLTVSSHLFWNSCSFFWEFPHDLSNQLKNSQLVIIKGDANYRRLLGDLKWPETTDIQDAVPYFPAPFVSLRTLKSDPIVGIESMQAVEELNRVDPLWKVNGKRGIIQSVLS